MSTPRAATAAGIPGRRRTVPGGHEPHEGPHRRDRSHHDQGPGERDLVGTEPAEHQRHAGHEHDRVAPTVVGVGVVGLPRP